MKLSISDKMTGYITILKFSSISQKMSIFNSYLYLDFFYLHLIIPKAFVKCCIVITNDCIKGICFIRFHAYFRGKMEFNP